MNKLIVISILSLLSFGFITKSEGQTISEKQTVLIKNQVDSVFQKMIALAENLDFDKLSSGVNDKHRAGFVSNGKYYAAYNTLINDVKSLSQGISKQNISIKEKKITVLSDKIVLLTASGTSKAIINDGRELSADFHWSFIFEKFDNNWKVIYSHQSNTR